MAVYFETDNPKQLLADFNAAVALDNSKGGIATWKKLASGHFTHEAAQWTGKAYFMPIVTAGRLTFNIVRPSGGKISKGVYGYYHGHLISTMLTHFDTKFSLGVATALATAGDLV